MISKSQGTSKGGGPKMSLPREEGRETLSLCCALPSIAWLTFMCAVDAVKASVTGRQMSRRLRWSSTAENERAH